ncbi:hypothetical protein [Listeria innocua]|uniref:hypothetical protein n=1 Tax=Listeria innocua TaxID=1642 RepID=UPI0021AD58D2|nr:hypothetical protein [Listeria innocua]
MKKQLVMVIMSCLVLGNIAPMVSVAVKDVDVTPILTQKEVESGVQDNSNELPDEFIVKDQISPSMPVNQERPLLRSATLGYEKWTKVSTTRKVSKGFIDWHPGWKNYQLLNATEKGATG